MNLVTLIYNLVLELTVNEKYRLTPQIKRSAISIPSNIAEGYGRNYRKDNSRFLQIARGPLFENQTQMEIAVNLDFIKVENLKEIKELSIEIEKMLNSLIKKLEE
jgi:four helix bundle protein